MMDQITISNNYRSLLQDLHNKQPAQESSTTQNKPSPTEDSARNSRVNSEKADKVNLSNEAREISKLSSTDRKVRAHEAAHVAAGGRYTGHSSFTYKQGPDGRRYAVAGEVSIDTSSVRDNPEATLNKAETVKTAALAPADPSPQDRMVAAKATQMATSARSEIRSSKTEESTATDDNKDVSVNNEPKETDIESVQVQNDDAKPVIHKAKPPGSLVYTVA